MAFLRRKKDSRYFFAGWKDENGKRVDRSTKIEAKPANKRQAQRIADEFETASRRKRSARQTREVIASLHQELTGEDLPTKTVKEYSENFLTRKEGESSAATIARYRTDIRDFLNWLKDRSNEDLNSIRSIDISEYRNTLLTRVCETTVTNKIKSIRTMFSAAQKEGLCMEEPTASLKLARKGKTSSGRAERRAFTIDELKIIRGEASGEWESMIMFGLYTGQRLGDLATLRWSHLDLQREEFRLHTRKTDRKVAIPLAAPLLEHILTLASSDDSQGYVHPQLAEAYENQRSTLSNQFNSLLADCGLRAPVSHRSKGIGRNKKRMESTVSFHSLRATAVTLLHEAGIPAATVEEWVGHDSAEVHRTYIKIGRETLQKATNALPTI